ncbi:hypothetical protein BESB_085650 [Besnoitia besnoiti]|uniref:Transmembrane protein n=1 Tax=Besnoitia besnoiti TaxID=94643 RepID=A0A2A9MBS7_BESBE|nr:hypothetical protein BESB_085650 [Besnoitia besnoiti]PFH33366.1 hypothetical protein BESB_085650 [Besnoitia besnoiti]
MIDRFPDLQRVVAGTPPLEGGLGYEQPVSLSGKAGVVGLQHPETCNDTSLATAGCPASAAAVAAVRYSKAIMCAGQTSPRIPSPHKTPSVSTAPSEAPPVPGPSSYPAHSPLSSFFPPPTSSVEVHDALKHEKTQDATQALDGHSPFSLLSPETFCSSETSGESMSDSAQSASSLSPTQRGHGKSGAFYCVEASTDFGGGQTDCGSSLFPFLRRAKVLKIAINEVLLQQQQTGYLLHLHSPGAAAPLQPYCCPGCAPNGGTGGSCQGAQDTGLCYNCELASHVHAAQQLLQRAHSALRQLQQQHEEDEQRHLKLQETQNNQHGSFKKHMHMQQASSAQAAELRIRRSVIQQHQQQLQVALEQQQQLEQDLRARWEGEVSAEMRILYPEASSAELQHAVQKIGESTFEGDHTTLAVAAMAAATTGSTEAADVLAAKCRQLQKLGASLLEVQRMMEEMQRQQQWRQQQLSSIAEAAACSRQNTASAIEDMLLARKYQRRAYKHSLLLIGGLVALFLFFFIPSSPFLPLLFWLHGEGRPP